MGTVIEFNFDGNRQLENLDAMVRIMTARLKLPSSAECPSGDLAAHLRSSAGNLRHLADLMTHAAIRMEAGALEAPLVNAAR